MDEDIIANISEEEIINVHIVEEESIVCNIESNIGSEGIVSNPPAEKLPVKNIYVDSVTKNLIVEYDDGR